MLAAMRAILPDLLNVATDVAGAVKAALSTEANHLEQQLGAVLERKRFLEEESHGAMAVPLRTGY